MKTRDPGSGPYTCIIIDDEEHASNELDTVLSTFGQVRVILKIDDPFKAVPAILENKPDLVFLDIQMPGMTGFDVMESLNHAATKPFVIFVTAFDRFAIKAIRYAAFDFLLKPFDKGEIAIALERFIKIYRQEEMSAKYSALLAQVSGKKIRFNTAGGFVLIDPGNIVYILADWNYSEIHLGKEKKEVVALNLGTIEEMLPAGSFARINRSVIINTRYLEKVHRIKRLCLLSKDGESFEFKIPLMRIRYLEKLL